MNISIVVYSKTGNSYFVARKIKENLEKAEHLVMPGLHKNSIMVFDWIKVNLPPAVINLMAHYKPAYRTEELKK